MGSPKFTAPPICTRRRASREIGRKKAFLIAVCRRIAYDVLRSSRRRSTRRLLTPIGRPLPAKSTRSSTSMTDAPRSSVAAASLAFGVWVATACALGLDFGRTARLPAAEPLPPAASQESQLDSHESAGEAANQRPLHFVNDVIPLLTKLGCNSGACHGRGTGQNGFKLSLFGFDSDADYAALVEEGEGRRISWTAPDESLILQKATGKVPHGGGVRLKADSGAYRLLRQWIAEGTPRGDQNAPTLTAIEVKPAERAIAPNETQQLEVIACYSDKSTRNITPTAEYFSQTGSGKMAATGNCSERDRIRRAVCPTRLSRRNRRAADAR